MNTRFILPVTIVVLLVGIAVAVTASRADRHHYQIPYQYAVGTTKNCKKSCVATVDQNYTFSSKKVASATWTANSGAADLRPWTEIQVHSMTATGESPELGEIAYVSDDSRLLTSRIESTVDGQAFPAHSRLQVHIIATIGKTRYRSITPIQIEALLQEGEWPQKEAQYTQVGTTELEDVNNPGQVALTLTNLQTTITALD